jgi:hypothetical protein
MVRYSISQIAFLVVSTVGTFAVLSIWAPVNIILIVLAAIAFVGGAAFGRICMLIMPTTVALIVIRAELVSTHPVRLPTFLLGTTALVAVIGGLAFGGSLIRQIAMQFLGKRQSI